MMPDMKARNDDQSPLRILHARGQRRRRGARSGSARGGRPPLRRRSRADPCRVHQRARRSSARPDPRGLQSSVVRRHFGIEDRARRPPRPALHLRVGHARRRSGDRGPQDRGDRLCAQDQAVAARPGGAARDARSRGKSRTQESRAAPCGAARPICGGAASEPDRQFRLGRGERANLLVRRDVPDFWMRSGNGADGTDGARPDSSGGPGRRPRRPSSAPRRRKAILPTSIGW